MNEKKKNQYTSAYHRNEPIWKLHLELSQHLTYVQQGKNDNSINSYT